MTFRTDQLTPDQAFGLAQQCIANGNSNQASQLLQHSLQRQPSHEGAALALSRLLYRHQQVQPAKQVLENAIAHGASSFELLYFAGAIQHLCKDFESAQRTLKQAIKKNKKSAEAYNILGSNCVELQQLDAAIDAFRKAIKLAPKHADAYNNIAWVYRSLGRKQEAIEHFKEAFSLNPEATEALSGLILLKTYSKHAPELEQAEQLLGKGLEEDKATELAFALGKAFEDMSNYNKAFQYFEQGNRLYRRRHAYSTSQDQELFEQLKAGWPAIRQNSDIPDHQAPQPIFIVGMPRSSTSLVEQILASHSLVHGAGELPLLESALLRNGRLLWEPANRDTLRSDYVSQIKKLGNGLPYVTDKMPQNFRFIGAILESFPGAKIIHCCRHPLDTCLSLYKHHFPMTSHPYAYDLESLATYYHLYYDLMQYWHRLAPGRIYDLHYETMVENFDRELTGLFDYLELELEPACLRFHETNRAVRTASSDQVRRGLYQSGKNQWKHYEKQLEPLRSSLSDLLSE